MPQPAAVLAPKRYQVLSGSALKAIAVVSMLIDHVAAHLLEADPQMTTVLFTAGTIRVSWYFILRTIGRLAFPIYCFLLVEGFVYTHDRKRYGCNLLAFALISEVPFDLVRKLTVVDITYQNVFWTLLLGYLGMYAYEKFANRPALQATCVIGLALVSMGLLCDYGARGYALILVLYWLRSNALAKTIIGCCMTLATWRAGLAFIPINLYNGQRGFVRNTILKYAFYAFYPVHLLVLWQMRLHLGA